MHMEFLRMFFPKCLEWRIFATSSLLPKSMTNFWGWFSGPSCFQASLHFQLNPPSLSAFDPIFQPLWTVGRFPHVLYASKSLHMLFPLPAELYSLGISSFKALEVPSQTLIDPSIYCLQQTQFRLKERSRLKVKWWKTVYHANRQQKRAEELH